MAENLLCAENSMTFLDEDDDLDSNAVSPIWNHHRLNRTQIKDPFFDKNRSDSLMSFSVQNEESIREMVGREKKHLPRDDYLKRLRFGDLELSIRREAFSWISKACAHFKYGPLSICLAMNYLDRFTSMYDLPRGKAWIVQLLAVACFSLAAKMEETIVPQSIDLQVGDPKFVFEGKTIKRMELLILNTLKWRLQVLTPCSYIDYFLSKLSHDQYPSSSSISRSLQLILSITKGIDFLEFRPSEIAAAVSMSVSADSDTQPVEEPCSFFRHVKKERVEKCVEMIKDMSLINGGGNMKMMMPESPNGVLEVGCLSLNSSSLSLSYHTNANTNTSNNNYNSNKSNGNGNGNGKRGVTITTSEDDDIRVVSVVGSCANSSSAQQNNTKRRKQDSSS